MTTKEIIIKYLKDHGYDGLCTEDCGCGIDNLFPCTLGNDFRDECVPAYKHLKETDTIGVYNQYIPDVWYSTRKPK